MVNVQTILNNLKTKVDDLDVGKLRTVSVDLKKLSDVVDNELVKNTKLNTLKAKVNRKEIPDASTLININQHNTDWRKLEKIPDTSNLVANTVLNTKISEVENKIRETSSLVTSPVLNTKVSDVENKFFDHAKYTTAHEFNKLTADNFAARLKQANLVNKTVFDNKLTSFNKQIISNKTKHLQVQTKLNSLITKYYNFF